jgi:hypothetical protein
MTASALEVMGELIRTEELLHDWRTHAQRPAIACDPAKAERAARCIAELEEALERCALGLLALTEQPQGSSLVASAPPGSEG